MLAAPFSHQQFAHTTVLTRILKMSTVSWLRRECWLVIRYPFCVLYRSATHSQGGILGLFSRTFSSRSYASSITDSASYLCVLALFISQPRRSFRRTCACPRESLPRESLPLFFLVTMLSIRPCHIGNSWSCRCKPRRVLL